MILDIITDIIKREGVKDTDNPNDSGGRTKYGISEKWDPEYWKNGPPTLAQAQQCYLQKYVVVPGFDKVRPPLQEQLVDFGVNSGPMTAIMHLQKLLGLTQDGKMGTATYGTLAVRDLVKLSNQLVDDRILFYSRIVQRNPKDLEFLFGWLSRALSFRL